MYRMRRKAPEYTVSGGSGRSSSGRFPLGISLLLAFMLVCGLYLRELSTRIAVSDACDIVTDIVNEAVGEIILAHDYGEEYFVSVSRAEDGSVSPASGNMAHINLLYSELLNYVIGTTENGMLHIGIPIGTLTGLSLLMGRGPEITVDIEMLTSSRVDYRSEVLSGGINQTDYRLWLDVRVDIDVLVPWGTESATVLTEVLVADTVIVGKVPQTFLNMEN